MFEPQLHPRVFALPIGVDFLECFVSGLLERLNSQPPEQMAKIEVFVNTRRTERRLRDLLIAQGALLLPRIRLITDIANDPLGPLDLPKPTPSLERRLKLAQLVGALIKQQPELGPKSSAFALADALADLLDEMQGEAVPFAALESIVDDHLSGHWQRSLQFLQIIAAHWDENALTDMRDRQRQMAEACSNHWQANPPDHPIFVVGSTGSRGETAAFMRAVANLPQGAVILPGVDQNMPETVWQTMATDDATLDHPQAVMAKLVRGLGLEIAGLPLWTAVQPTSPDRNALVSLAMRPAPVTDQWLTEGPLVAASVGSALADMEIIEAPSAKDEAGAIALRLRKAVADGVQAVLISPDRVLTRRVTAALKQWNIVPDDSGGEPLHLTPPGIFLRLTASLLGEPLSPAKLIAVLKHPLAHSAKGGNGNNRRFAREMELSCLRGSGPVVDFDAIEAWVKKREDPEVIIWFKWLKDCFGSQNLTPIQPLSFWIEKHKALAEKLAGGSSGDPSELWAKEAGKQALKLIGNIQDQAQHGGEISAPEYRALFHQLLTSEEARDPTEAHPLVSIWGTLEARVQGAELVILAGLNDGTWPKLPDPDPWLNRSMRKSLGLLLPERQTGLSAHDFQQAIAAKQVVLSRAERDGESPTIPSRWVIRLFNLINGLGPEAKAELTKTKQRGLVWLDLARELGEPKTEIPRATRPSPRPPVAARPRKLSVTKIETLIRNPYEIYARHILKLRKLDPLGRDPDALARGNAYHAILENFVQSTNADWPDDPVAHLMALADKTLHETVPWPAARRLWYARLSLVADWFIDQEVKRRAKGTNIALERKGQLILEQIEFTLTVKADRLDELDNGQLAIFDYKAGKPPSPIQIRQFNKQLYLEALIAMKGGFDDLPSADVGHLEFIGLHQDQRTQVLDIDPELLSDVEVELIKLLAAYLSESKGFTARDRVLTDAFPSDYDHLSRRGEWQDSDAPDPQVVP